jgi:L-amino acid N-acyltransferase YncA
MSEGRSRLTVEPLAPGDWEAVAAIYAEGIATGNATFETAVPAYGQWDAAHLRGHRLVARADGLLVGWAALSAVSGRAVYAGVAENSIYIAAAARGQGIGRLLLQALVEGAERDGIWTIQTGIFPENRASIALHERCGYRIVGTRERLGSLGGVWRDVVLMERRSAVVG